MCRDNVCRRVPSPLGSIGLNGGFVSVLLTHLLKSLFAASRPDALEDLSHRSLHSDVIHLRKLSSARQSRLESSGLILKSS